MTEKLYLEDTYTFHCEGLIQEVGKDENGTFIILDRTVFYPQGGGQPADHGMIKNNHFEAQVIHVGQQGDVVRHYTAYTTTEIVASQKVHGIVDQKRRLINARYHTAGHLLSNIVGILHPKLKAMKGHSFPSEAYVEFQGDEAIDIEALQHAINAAIANNDTTTIFEINPLDFEEQFYKLPYNIPDNKKFRVMQIGDMSPVPCGGTHVSSIGEIGLMRINKIKNKTCVVRISYGVT